MPVLLLSTIKSVALSFSRGQRYDYSSKKTNLFVYKFMGILYLCSHQSDRSFMEYMSKEGYDKLVAELNQMVNVELPQVRDAIAEARDKGDLSENFEYHAAKREQGRLLSRIRFKQRVLENARVLDTTRINTGSVQLLSKVEMTNMANDNRMTYTIASPHEADLRAGKISIKSPIAEALLGKKVGDVVEVRVPAGLLKLRIESICLGG